MSPRNASRLGWGIWALTLALSLATLPLTRSAASDLGFMYLTLVLSTVGAVVVARRPANAIGWMFCAAAFGIGLVFLASAYAIYTYQVAEGRLLGAALVLVYVGCVVLLRQVLAPLTGAPSWRSSPLH